MSEPSVEEGAESGITPGQNPVAESDRTPPAESSPASQEDAGSLTADDDGGLVGDESSGSLLAEATLSVIHERAAEVGSVASEEAPASQASRSDTARSAGTRGVALGIEALQEQAERVVARTVRAPQSLPHRFDWYRREEVGLERRSPCKPLWFAPVEGRPDNDTFVYRRAPSGTHRSRRRAAAHYGIPIAGYVSRLGEDLPVDEEGFPSIPSLPDQTFVDAANGLSNDCVLAMPNEFGLWPMGILNSRSVAWVEVPLFSEGDERTASFFGRPVSICASLPCVAELRHENRIDNHVLSPDGAHFQGFETTISDDDTVAWRDFCVAYNGMRLRKCVYEGAYPSLSGDSSLSSLPGSDILANVERVYQGTPGLLGIAYHVQSETFFAAGGERDLDAMEVVDKAIALAQGLVGARGCTTRVPGFTAEPLPFVDSFSSIPDEHRPRDSPIYGGVEGIFNDADLAAVPVPGTAAVRLREASIVEGYEVCPSEVPLVSNLTHPHATAAQIVYTRIVAASQAPGKWARVSLPSRDIARVAYRQDRGGPLHHAGDTASGGFVRSALVSTVTPQAWFFRPSGPGVIPCLDAARAALIRAVYQHGSSATGGTSFGKVTVDESVALPVAQSYVGLNEDGSIAQAFAEQEVSPVLPDVVKRRLEGGSEAAARSLTAQLFDCLLGSIPAPVIRRQNERAVAPSGGANEAPPLGDSMPADQGPPEMGSLVSLLGKQLQDDLTEEDARLLAEVTGVDISVTRRLGQRVIAGSSCPPRAALRPSRTPWEVAAMISSDEAVSPDRLIGALVATRAINPRDDDSGNRSCGTLLRDARRSLRAGNPRGARSALMRYVRKGGELLPFEDDVWREGQYTWEAANILVAPVGRSGRQTWADVMYDALDHRMTYVARTSRDILELLPRRVSRAGSSGANAPIGAESGRADQRPEVSEEEWMELTTPIIRRVDELAVRLASLHAPTSVSPELRSALTSLRSSADEQGGAIARQDGVDARTSVPNANRRTDPSLEEARALLRAVYSRRTNDRAADIIAALTVVARGPGGSQQGVAQQCLDAMSGGEVPAGLRNSRSSLAAVITARRSEGNPF